MTDTSDVDEYDDAHRPIDDQFDRNVVCAGLGVGKRALRVDQGGRYQLLDRVGRGAMGSIYRTLDTKLGRTLALKVVSNTSRGLREAQALAQVVHPNVVRIHDIFEAPTGEPVIILEYLEGPTLRAWQADHNFAERVEAYLAAARGLEHAHRAGVVHRDFKPENAVVTEEAGVPRVAVVDFGLAGGFESDARERGWLDPIASAGHGTPGYMAPEQHARAPDPRADQYALCVALWEAVCAERPFAARRRANDEIPPAPRGMPPWLYRILARGLAFDPDRRFADMRALGERLERGLLWHRVSRPLFLALPLGGVLAGASVAIVHALQPDPCALRAAEIEAIWNPAAERRIRAAFAPLDEDWTQQSVGESVALLNLSAANWSQQARAICEAELRDGSDRTLESSSKCLDDWRNFIGELVGKLQAGDQGVVTNVIESFEPIAADEVCRTPPVMIDPQVRQLLTQADVAKRSRDFPLALAKVDAAAELAAAADSCVAADPGQPSFSYEHASVELARGLVLLTAERWDAALAAFDSSISHATICTDKLTLFKAHLYASIVHAIRGSRPELARGDWTDARDWLLSATGSHEEHSLHAIELLRGQGWVLLREGEPAHARAMFERALELLETHSGLTLPLRLKLNNGIARSYYDEGDFEHAALIYERSTERLAERLSDDHPETLRRSRLTTVNRGLIDLEQGDWQAASDTLRQVDSIPDLDPVLGVRARAGRIQALTELHEFELAASLGARAGDWLDQHPELPAVAQAELLTTAAYAATYHATDDDVVDLIEVARAVEYLKRALPLWGDDPQADIARFNLATNLYSLHELPRAERLLAELRLKPTIEDIPGLASAISDLQHEIDNDARRDTVALHGDLSSSR